MRKRLFLWIWPLGLLLACHNRPPVSPGLQSPEVVDIIAPPKAFLQDSLGIAVHAKIQDPQGSEDIARVQCILIKADQSRLELDMQDNGKDGDILPQDGQFMVRIPGFLWGTTGTAAITIRATDQAANEATSDSVEIEILPGTQAGPPKLLSLAFPDTVWADSSYQVQLLAQVSDPDGLADINLVNYDVFPPMHATPSLSGILSDDGSQDDGIAGNGLFGTRLGSNIFTAEPGIFTLRVRAIDQQGEQSAAKLKTFYILSRLENLPPVIVSVAAPDTISRSRQQSAFVIRAVVMDPNGLGDVARVFFNSFLPDGTPASGNPFFMRDDGKKDNNGLGDAIANDGEYSLTIVITTSTTLGTFRFEFQAEDRGGLLSEKVIHNITVIQ